MPPGRGGGAGAPETGRVLASLKPVEAMERLLKKLAEFETNEEFLASF